MRIVSKFGERLNELIAENALTVKALSEAVGCGTDCIYEWLSEKRGYLPSLQNLFRLADYFSCSLSFLLGIKEENDLSKPKSRKSFPDWFRTAVESRGYSLHRLSTATGMTTGIFYKWINGKSQPSLDSLLRIAKVLDCSLDYLVGRE